MKYNLIGSIIASFGIMILKPSQNNLLFIALGLLLVFIGSLFLNKYINN